MNNYRDLIPTKEGIRNFFFMILCMIFAVPMIGKLITDHFGDPVQKKLESLCEGHDGISLKSNDFLVCNDSTTYVLLNNKLTDSRCIEHGKINPDIGWDDLDCGNLGD